MSKLLMEYLESRRVSDEYKKMSTCYIDGRQTECGLSDSRLSIQKHHTTSNIISVMVMSGLIGIQFNFKNS